MKENTKPTQEENKQFLYQFYGQDVLVRTKSKYPYKAGESVTWPAMYTINVDNVIAELTPLSYITDEDAIEVLKIFKKYSASYNYLFITKTNTFGETFRQAYTEDPHKDGGSQGIDAINVHGNFSDRGLHSLHSNRDETYWKALDFLRSKGYALPWRGYTVEQLISFGWLKLKQKGGGDGN